MENLNPNQERIDRYLADEMTAEERLAFEQDLAADQGLSQELERHQSAYAAVKVYGQLALKEKLQGWETEIQGSKGKIQPFRFPRVWAVAAAVVLLFAVGLWWWNSQALSPQELYASHFESYRAPVNLRSENPDAITNWQKASDAYAQGDFESAAELFGQTPISGETPIYLIAFYQAMSYLNQSPPQAAKAIPLLEQVLEEDSDYQEAAKWYLALGYLQLGDLDKSKQILQKMLSGNYKWEEANALLEAMD